MAAFIGWADRGKAHAECRANGEDMGGACAPLPTLCSLEEHRFSCTSTTPTALIYWMPAHKNQHFVPRCALKPFSLNGEGKAINVFNISSSRAIENAPLKGQCARDYLYAKEDLRAEQLLAQMEGHYARIVANLSTDSVLSQDDVAALKMLILVQTRRTELAIDRIREFAKSMNDKVYAGSSDQRPLDTRSDRELMHMSLRFAGRMIVYIKDLKLVVFRNKTPIDFVTCDNPALLTNRFYFQKLKQNTFGISNSGTILAMAISPRLSVICYDTRIYSIPNASGTQFIDVTTVGDVHAINQLQYLAASKNIYFSRWSDAERIGPELHALAGKRSQLSVPVSTVYIRDDSAKPVVAYRHPESGKMEKYRKGTPEEEKAAKESLVATSFEFAEPLVWPSKLKFWNKPKYYNTHTGAGYIRKAEWLHRSRGS